MKDKKGSSPNLAFILSPSGADLPQRANCVDETRFGRDLAEKWRARLPIVEAQLEREPALAWHWRAEIRVLRFLVRRYGQDDEIAPPDWLALLDLSDESDLAESPELLAPELSALERSILRLSLLIPNAHTKHGRPSSRDRAAILERIAGAGEEARQTPEPESLLEDIALWLYPPHRRQADARLRERQAEWERIRRYRAWELRERRRRW